MSDARLISWGEYLSKLPTVFSALPRFKKGLAFAKGEPGKRIGLAWSLDKAVDLNPDGVAIHYEDRAITYKALGEWSNQIAHYLKSRGVKEQDVVSVFIENRPELLAVCAAISKLGAIAALVNTSQKGAVLVHSINLVKPKLLLLGEEGYEAIKEIQPELKVELSEPVFIADNDTLTEKGTIPESCIDFAAAVAEQAKSDLPIATSKMDDPLFYIYTSGTTGLPKAARISNFRWTSSYGGIGFATMRLGKDDVFYSTLPMYHATGMVVCWATALSGGSGFALRRKFSAREFWNDCRKYNVTAIGYVGELCRYLMNQPANESDRQHNVKVMLGNGLRPGVWKPFKERFGIDRVMELYSASESNVGLVNMFNFDESVGFQMGKSALVEFDKETELPIRNSKGFATKAKKGGKGLLLGKITDANPFEGYTDKDKSNSKILRDLFKKGDAWFDTGDVMRDIGFMHLQFVDRLGDTYRWKGENVSTTEVENLMTECDHISESVAYGVEIPETNGRAGMASICLEKSVSEFDFANAFSQMKAKMPAYALPVFLRIREQMDTTGTFKHKKSDLKEESYDVQKVQDAIYVLLPNAEEYVQLTPEMKEDINKGAYRF